jgi:hypothetical protein
VTSLQDIGNILIAFFLLISFTYFQRKVKR